MLLPICNSHQGKGEMMEIREVCWYLFRRQPVCQLPSGGAMGVIQTIWNQLKCSGEGIDRYHYWFRGLHGAKSGGPPKSDIAEAIVVVRASGSP
jgi:hypothetical protein